MVYMLMYHILMLDKIIGITDLLILLEVLKLEPRKIGNNVMMIDLKDILSC